MNDYSKCKVDPSAHDFVDRFKQLHPDFQVDLELKEVKESSLFTYVVLTYDIYSPYVERYKNWAHRRRETARASGFKVNGTKYLKEAEEIIVGRSDVVNKIIVRYLFLQNDLEFIKFQSYQSLYFRQIEASMSTRTLTPSELKTLKGNIDALSSEIKDLQKLIFSGDESKNLLMAIYDFAANITYDFRPEDIAEKKESEEEIVNENPYKRYKPDDLVYLDDK